MIKVKDEFVVNIQSLSTEGKGISHILNSNFVIFVDNALPGDVVRVKIKKKKSNYAEALVEELITPSPYRVAPKCKHFGVCGGCKLQSLSYEKQLNFKLEIVKNAFEKIGKFSNLTIFPPLGSPQYYFYRNKMEFSFSDDEWIENSNKKKESCVALGLHIPKFHSKILNIEECFLQSELSFQLVNFIRDFFRKRNVSVYSTKMHSGYLRFLIIRNSKYTGDLLVNLITYNYNDTLIKELADTLRINFPEVTTFVNSLSTKKAQVAYAESEFTIWGSGHIYEILNNSRKFIKYKISGNSFFQPNSLQAERLFSTAEAGLKLNKEDNILDLYCGAGSISLFIADLVNEVTGVELVDDAVLNAIDNASLNDIHNVHFIKADIKEFLETLVKKNLYNKYNKIILDPPRSGLHPKVCSLLTELDIEKICYISCNPITQARDLKVICEKGKYKITSIQPVDMFPHTYHIENIVQLEKT
ncbi:MAG: 23S rRNA (uracil(1939)-C(5))-methyltransferase RlmD [Ignavibacteria bacterium]